ncbi:MAG TPA: heavy-metal-associated domain-containing protein, partial [Sphingomonas sp.]
MTVAACSPSPQKRSWPLLALPVVAALGGLAAWHVGAQLAPGDRGVPPIDTTSSLEVTGVAVDVAGRTAEEARGAAWREAQRKAWKILWAKGNGASPDAAPGLPDSTLDGIVSGIEVEKEQVGPNRYIATLGVQFDRGRVGAFLSGDGQGPHSEPMLVIPVQFAGGGAQSFEARTAWQKAWARFRSGASPVDYIRPVGTGPDPLLLNLGQSRRPGRIWWRMLLDQYSASDIVIPEVHLERRFPGGPIVGRFIARHGPDGTALGGFSLLAGSTDGLDRMLDEGVSRLDQIYVTALREGNLSPDPSLTIEESAAPANDALPTDADDPLSAIVERALATPLLVDVPTPDAAALDAAEAAMRAVPGARLVATSSLALGGTSI